MRGKGVFGDHSQPRSWSGKKTLKSCKGKGKVDVVIDVDSNEYDTVIIVDVPESLQQKFQGPRVLGKDRNFPHSGVISVDDDESNTVDYHRIGAEGGGNVDSNGNSRKTPIATDFMQNSVDAEGDDCQVIWEKGNAFKSSSCEQTNSVKAPRRNRYGLSSHSDISLSESDSSDCEVMEDSFGKFREQWEKASHKRKYNSSRENRSEQHTEAHVCSSSSNGQFEEEHFAAFIPTCDECLGCSFNPGITSPFVNSQCPLKSHYPDWKADVAEDPQQSYNHVSRSHATSCDDGQNYQRSSFSNREQADAQDSSRRTSQDEEQNFRPEHSKLQPGVNMHFDHWKDGVQNEDAFLCKSRHLGEGQVNEKVVSSDNDERTDFVGREKDICRKPEWSHPPSDETQVENGVAPSDGNDGLFSEYYFSSKIPSSGYKSQLHDDDRDPFHDHGIFQRDLINEREKLKETDEYRRAVEEEWASRQQQVQIQAEEAQRLRKRIKAESMRLLDMKRRQKKRLEEVRETQKKDEENMNLKEQLRVEIRNELCKLEMSCIDMASLLRSLGVPVGGGFRPLSHEVHAAYKRALLKFHPDRASTADIRQQVEAEEKFKLISRMKEKFLTTSFR
ncbi:DnaJ domain-containing protein [Cephalotus follicularis]|uniref:DnaJ domain-containing protein n=1 Tax=Cephalotus follicularis TaxID=3775 RepID=A0A1Q3CHH1_CEPFO|nr:DnaJ domain-containing protein [Cephalotus follicularis]